MKSTPIRIPFVCKSKADGEMQAYMLARYPGKWVREVWFCHPKRNYRFDYALADETRKVAIEFEGIYYSTEDGRSAHTDPMGYQKDCYKYNAAALLGWKVYRITYHMVMKTGYAFSLIDYLTRPSHAAASPHIHSPAIAHLIEPALSPSPGRRRSSPLKPFPAGRGAKSRL